MLCKCCHASGYLVYSRLLPGSRKNGRYWAPEFAHYVHQFRFQFQVYVALLVNPHSLSCVCGKDESGWIQSSGSWSGQDASQTWTYNFKKQKLLAKDVVLMSNLTTYRLWWLHSDWLGNTATTNTKLQSFQLKFQRKPVQWCAIKIYPAWHRNATLGLALRALLLVMGNLFAVVVASWDLNRSVGHATYAQLWTGHDRATVGSGT